jgi:cell wall-associated NlpC family hydrolase
MVRGAVAVLGLLATLATLSPPASAQEGSATTTSERAKFEQQLALWVDSQRSVERLQRREQIAEGKVQRREADVAQRQAEETRRRARAAVFTVETYVAGSSPRLPTDAVPPAEQSARVLGEEMHAVWRHSRNQLDEAVSRLEEAQAVADDLRTRRGRAQRAEEIVRTQVDQTIARIEQRFRFEADGGLPVAAWAAYHRVASDAPCDVPAGVLAAAGAVVSGHGRNGGRSLDPDGSVHGDDPKAPTAVVATRRSTPSGVRPLGATRTESAALAGALCAAGALDSWRELSSALDGVYRDPIVVERILATAHRLTGLDPDVGPVPQRPLRISRTLTVPAEQRLAANDVPAMMWWAVARIGTPYSQCIGRPQDPVCPPGTNRYGDGFFDCSGFVAAAYARIGVGVPLTTYAMEADADFMATKVADRITPDIMLPGDVLLMDGHVMLYFGDGNIIHSSAGGVQIEPVPAYAQREVFAVLRPVPPALYPPR